MISVPQIQLNICRDYIRHVREIFSTSTYESDRFILILQIREWQLKRRVRNLPLSLDNLQTLKTGIREAEVFLHSLTGGQPKSVADEIADILRLVILELTKEIIHTEEMYPALKPIFDRERAEYRRIKDEADAAMQD